MKVLRFLIIIAVVFGCSEKKESEKKEGGFSFELSGTIKNGGGKKLYLDKLENQSWIHLDSTEIGSDGSYKFEGALAEPDYALLQADTQNVLLIIDAPVIKFNSDLTDLPGNASVEGSKATAEYLTFFNQMSELQKSQNKLQQKGMLFQMKKQEDSIPAIMAELKGLQEKVRKLTITSIDSVLPSLSVFSMVNYLDFQSELPFLKKVADEMNKAYPNSKYTKLLSSEVQKALAMKKQEEEKEKLSKVGVGKKAPEIALPNPNGKIIKLSDFKGKYVMIDFWASWCGPCRMENPHVVELYKKYKDKGFTILGVSLDEDKEKWKNAIMKDGLVWEQVSDLKGWGSSVNPVYEVQAIPLTYLIDKEGIIIAKNLRGQDLANKLEELFGK
ncbi:MAG: AhpC/TSA family protein [Sporocytophaga sp.]|uniref:TlpA disulfide reductase family protein n=1 Tax=Sporocytophaga sp. TaxID=2231183 RepID=UPI001B061057|nr:TlpA disulfide reductase family protein [Sporocytophaga sp.]MBO9701231.1 AhpC/TSA family protein [Sporocytophaga sp.]